MRGLVFWPAGRGVGGHEFRARTPAFIEARNFQAA